MSCDTSSMSDKPIRVAGAPNACIVACPVCASRTIDEFPFPFALITGCSAAPKTVRAAAAFCGAAILTSPALVTFILCIPFGA